MKSSEERSSIGSQSGEEYEVDEDYEKYLDDLIYTCYEWMKKAIKRSKAKEIRENESFRQYMSLAFTHKSIDRDNNYELLESEGDLILKGTTGPYIFEIYDEQYEYLSPDIINNVSKVYVSNETYATIMKKEGLIDFIEDYDKIMKKQEKDIAGDVFEAMIASIFKSTSEIYGIGEAYQVIYDLTKYSLNKYMKTYDLSDPGVINILKNPTQYLKELFNKLGWGDPIYKWDVRSSRMNILNPSNKVIAYGTDRIKSKAKSKAVRLALKEVRKIISSNEESRREMSKKERLSMRELEVEAGNKVRELGYTSGIQFTTSVNTGNLIIYTKKGKRDVKLAEGTGKTKDDKKRDAYNKILLLTE